MDTCQAILDQSTPRDIDSSAKSAIITNALSVRRFKSICTNRGILVLSLALVIFALIVVTGARVHTVHFPEHLGNHPGNVARTSSTTDPDNFRFWVVGDVKCGTATFKALLDLAVEDKPAFVVILGDFVKRAELARHKLFASQMADYTQHFPIFLVPGNHDIGADTPFTLKDFESMYGPSQFSFTIGKKLFVVLNDISPRADKGNCLEFLETTLDSQVKEMEQKFVFMHIPPSGLDLSLECGFMPDSKKFLELVDNYDIDYVFTGHHHGYAKVEKNGTNFIITGGGGQQLEGAHGRFHHMMRMSVINGKATESVIATKRHPEAFKKAERQIVANVWPLITRNSLSVTVTLFLALIALWRLVTSIREIAFKEFKV